MMQRKNFGKLKDVLEIPDLISVQTKSYSDFLQKDKSNTKRKSEGLQEVFGEIFPIESFDKQMVLNFDSYEIGNPKTKVIDCIKDGGSYSAPLNVSFSLNMNGESIKERVFLGDIPMMTNKGTFVINGAERVIVSQLHRSPGVCYEKTRHTSGRSLYSYRVIPDRGSWLEVQFDINDLMYMYLDRRRRRRKFLITTFLRAIGYKTNYDMLSEVYKVAKYTIKDLLKVEDLSSYYTLNDILSDEEALLIEEVTPLNDAYLKALQEANVNKIELVHVVDGNNYLINCLQRDPVRTYDDALKEIYKRMRPGDPPSATNAEQLLNRLLFDVRRYDLGAVGRHKINKKFGFNLPLTERGLRKEDIMASTIGLMELRNTGGDVDDIDHLGSRRVRLVGELLQNHCRIGLVRTERLVRERMTLLNAEEVKITPSKLINPKAFAGVVRDFFARNQLSQFMDQTNPLAELTNKRRVSALGPGGLTRERAGFEVRDVHTSHYGRVCPIETPEGPNIGLIASMALYSRVNSLGFLETPYRKVKKHKVTSDIEYLTADLEEEYIIAQANAPLNEDGSFINDMVMTRFHGDSQECKRNEVQYMDVSPKQLVSAAAGLIPFLENDDANRALMGSNMQRQAVPLMFTDSPCVGTGLEAKIAVDTRAVLTSGVDGIIAAVSGSEITITPDGKELDKTKDPKKAKTYKLNKFLRTNAGTSFNQRPIVKTGDKVEIGTVLADGASTQNGELALGRNAMVAFMPWGGYNFEDAIVISERLVKDDVYTSIHVNEFEIIARDTKLGPEEITRDIPNVSEDSLQNLGTDGIIELGAEVKPGDILVGKITPKSETELAPEERLLRAIFGEKAADVKDSSLTVSSGKGGIVMDVRKEYSKDPNRQTLTKSEIRRQVRSAKETYKSQFSEIVEELGDELEKLMLGQKLPCPIYDSSSSKANAMLISSNRRVTRTSIMKLANKYNAYRMEECSLRNTIDEIMEDFIPRFNEVTETRDTILKYLSSGQISNLGIIKRVKIYVASKRKLQVGDKMAGRHGNKGIVSKIVPEEDMPFLPDGTPVDIILNPLGVPSRMNVGQVLEIHLGWAAKLLNMKFATPVFDGISEKQIIELMKQANKEDKAKSGVDYNWGFVKRNGKMEFDGKADLYDGRTGTKFDQRVTVGNMYVIKLDHLIANKIHARAVGPYSLVTQQPLGGKAQHGGQRFGEMEVWALEAYGAAYTLQEMLTVKSDDVNGRARIYESIVRGQNALEAGRPESFNVLLKELHSLALDIRPIKNKK